MRPVRHLLSRAYLLATPSHQQPQDCGTRLARTRRGEPGCVGVRRNGGPETCSCLSFARVGSLPKAGGRQKAPVISGQLPSPGGRANTHFYQLSARSPVHSFRYQLKLSSVLALNVLPLGSPIQSPFQTQISRAVSTSPEEGLEGGFMISAPVSSLRLPANPAGCAWLLPSGALRLVPSLPDRPPFKPAVGIETRRPPLLLGHAACTKPCAPLSQYRRLVLKSNGEKKNKVPGQTKYL